MHAKSNPLDILTAAERAEHDLLFKELAEKDKAGVAFDTDLQRRIAAFVLGLLQKATTTNNIQKYCYVAAGFLIVQFSDELDSILFECGELELPVALWPAGLTCETVRQRVKNYLRETN